MLTTRPNPLRRLWAAIEPWYDWGTVNTTNMDARSEADVVEGEIRFFDLQWLGLHVGVQFGRAPKREG
jgi:hypothetical protein